MPTLTHERSGQAAFPALGRAVLCAAMLAPILACGGAGGGSGGLASASAPTVTGIQPVDGATDVDPTAPLVVTFDQAIDPATLDAASFRVSVNGTPHAGALAVNGAVVTFTPSRPYCLLGAGTLELSEAIANFAGLPLVPESASFTVRDGAWTAPELIANGLFFDDVGANPGGGATGVLLSLPNTWSDLSFTRFEPGFGWQPPVALISDGTVVSAALATGEGGAGVLVACRWLGGASYRIVASRRDPATGLWSPAEPISALLTSVSEPRVEWSGAGVAFAAWLGAGGVDVWVNRMDLGGGWSGPELLAAGVSGSSEPDLAADGHGNALVLWLEAGGTEIWAGRYAAEPGAWAAPELVYWDPACCIARCRGAVNDAGDAVVLWSDADSVLASARDAASGMWLPAVPVSAAPCATPLEELEVALGSDGSGFAIWGCGGDLVVSRLDATGWGPVAPLETSDEGPARHGRIAVDGCGHAVAAWDQELPAGARSVWARRYVAGLGWEAPVAIDDVGGTCAVAPRLALAGDGRAFVAWTSTVACDFTQGFGSYVRRFE
ncbi:MAG: hypothetical protein E2O39_17430 [Planctomycetota bacterium]|nr:MAG: hypothetical protein E2O39_17430 [Planctomycetota bacterium]